MVAKKIGGTYAGTPLSPELYAHLKELTRLADCSIAEGLRRIIARATPEDMLPMVPSELAEALGCCKDDDKEV